MTKQARYWNPKPHRAKPYDEKAIQKIIDEYDVVHVGVKVDGIRALLIYEYDRMVVTTRSGIVIKCLDTPYWYDFFFDNIPVELREVGYTLDMEIWLDGIPFDETSGHFRRQAELPHELPLRITLLDYAKTDHYLKGNNVDRVTSYQRRTEFMAGNFYHPGHEYAGVVTHDFLQVIGDVSQLPILFDDVRGSGFEGLVIKDPRLTMKNDKVAGWYKYKPEISVDGIICGFVYGDSGKANAGKIVGFEVRLEECDGGEVIRATGLTQENIARVTKHVHEENSSSLYLGRYVEVSAMERTPAGKLRHPKFKQYRDLDYVPGVKL